MIVKEEGLRGLKVVNMFLRERKRRHWFWRISKKCQDGYTVPTGWNTGVYFAGHRKGLRKILFQRDDVIATKASPETRTHASPGEQRATQPLGLLHNITRTLPLPLPHRGFCVMSRNHTSFHLQIFHMR